MNKIMKIGVGLLFASLPFTASSASIELEYGANYIDFNHDGVKDIVIKSRRNLNDTFVDMVTVYIKGADERVYILPSIYANALSLYDNQLKNSDIKISNFKFVEKKDNVVLLSLEKMGNNMTEPSSIRFSSYIIEEQKNKKESEFKWVFSSHCITKTHYLSVDDAYSDECFNKIINE